MSTKNGSWSVARVRELWGLYWTRGTAGRETPAELFSIMYAWWFVALVLKLLGGSWDISWHFETLRDDLAPPHDLNTVGTGIAVALVLFHTYTGYGADRRTLRWMQWGTGIFLVAIPIDVVNHNVNGLDITTWSPSHSLLFIGTAAMLIGVAMGWYRGAGRGRWFTAGWLVLLTLVFEDFWFPNEQQEYGILELASWDRDPGHPYADRELLEFAANQIGRPVGREALAGFSLPMPDWVYPAWGIGACVVILAIGRQLIGRRWTATAMAGLYVGFRALLWLVLSATHFPPSAVPFFLIAAGLAVDAVFLLPISQWLRPMVGAVLVTVASYALLAVQSVLLSAPPRADWSAPVAAGSLLVLWLAATWFLHRYPLRTPQGDSERLSTADHSG
ncbi:hypothetical protein [Kutzneria albida]|uniref:hypothetical protein n=1 Tax=Kutzneria albida TaxID=43357 RepID=UPI0004B8DD2D|nr:hypothetical protein [Kutzneria albida]